MNNDPGIYNTTDKCDKVECVNREKFNIDEKEGANNERVTDLNEKERVCKERYTMEDTRGANVLGLKEFRNNISDIVYLAINGFQEILTGNVKKGGKTVSLISTELLDNILECYRFTPSVTYDEETKQYEIILKEINAAGTGDTKEEATEILLDNIEMLTEDFFENIELYMRMAQYKEQYPYYMRIKHCIDKDRLRKVLSLD